MSPYYLSNTAVAERQAHVIKQRRISPQDSALLQVNLARISCIHLTPRKRFEKFIVTWGYWWGFWCRGVF